MSTGYFGIGIEHVKTGFNVGTLWRSASVLGAAFIFTVGRRYRPQTSDTSGAWKSLPLYHHDTLDDLYKALPYDCVLVGVEMAERAVPIRGYAHPPRAVYLLGSEDQGLTPAALARCHHLIALPGVGSLNVAVAGSIVMFDRHSKQAGGGIPPTRPFPPSGP